MKMALFAAFFTHRRDLNDVQVLGECASEIGLQRDEALAVLEDGRHAQEVRDAEHLWVTRGIHGVPAMVFQQRYLLSGAQGVENYGAALMQIAGQHELDPHAV